MLPEAKKFSAITQLNLLREELKATEEELSHYPNYSVILTTIEDYEEKIENLEKSRKELSKHMEVRQDPEEIDKIINEYKRLCELIETELNEFKKFRLEIEKISHLKLHRESLKEQVSELEKLFHNVNRPNPNERWDVAKKAVPMVTKPIAMVSSIGKSGMLELAPVFMDLAKSLLSPVDYFIKGCFAIRDFATTETATGQRKTKLGAALLIAAASFAYVGLTATIAVHTFLGVSVAAVTLAAIPIAGPILLAGIAGIGLAKESYILHSMRNAIQREKNVIALKENEIKSLTQSPKDIAKINRLSIQIQIHKNNLNKMRSNRRFQKRRVGSGTLITMGYIVSAFGLLFPPLLFVGAAMVVGSVSLDAYDKYKQRSEIAAAKVELATYSDKTTTYTHLSEKDKSTSHTPSVEKKPQKEVHADDIQLMLAAHNTHPEHTKNNINKAIDLAKAELEGLDSTTNNESSSNQSATESHDFKNKHASDITKKEITDEEDDSDADADSDSPEHLKPK